MSPSTLLEDRAPSCMPPGDECRNTRSPQGDGGLGCLEVCTVNVLHTYVRRKGQIANVQGIYAGEEGNPK